MEENPPSSRRRDTPRARTPRAAFSAPEPASTEESAEQLPGRAAKPAPSVTFQPASAEERPAPPSTAGSPGNPFAPVARPKPADKPTPSGTGAPRSRPASTSGTGQKPPSVTIPPEQPVETVAEPPRKATPRKARLPRAVPAKAGTPQTTLPVKAPPPARPESVVAEQPALVAEPTVARRPPVKAAPAKKATPAKRAPRKTPAPALPATTEPPTATEPPPAEPSATAPPTTAPATKPPTAATPLTATVDPARTAAVSAAIDANAEPSIHPRPPTPVPALTTPDPQAPESSARPVSQDEAATPSDQTQRTPESVTTLAPGPQQPVPSEAWAKLLADPAHAPELLALAAVETLGPRAQEWAARTRESYPKASEQALARLATRQFTRFGSLGSVFGAVAGSYAPIALLGTAALTHAEVVLHVAAAYGWDPTDPQRAAELLVLSRVHPTRTDAEAALAAAKRPAYDGDGRFPDAVWRLGRLVAAQTGAWGVLRLANRFFPGASLLAAVLSSHASAQGIGVRANSFYRAQTQVSQE